MENKNLHEDLEYLRDEGNNFIYNLSKTLIHHNPLIREKAITTYYEILTSGVLDKLEDMAENDDNLAIRELCEDVFEEIKYYFEDIVKR